MEQPSDRQPTTLTWIWPATSTSSTSITGGLDRHRHRQEAGVEAEEEAGAEAPWDRTGVVRAEAEAPKHRLHRRYNRRRHRRRRHRRRLHHPEDCSRHPAPPAERDPGTHGLRHPEDSPAQPANVSSSPTRATTRKCLNNGGNHHPYCGSTRSQAYKAAWSPEKPNKPGCDGNNKTRTDGQGRRGTTTTVDGSDRSWKNELQRGQQNGGSSNGSWTTTDDWRTDGARTSSGASVLSTAGQPNDNKKKSDGSKRSKDVRKSPGGEMRGGAKDAANGS